MPPLSLVALLMLSGFASAEMTPALLRLPSLDAVEPAATPLAPSPRVVRLPAPADPVRVAAAEPLPPPPTPTTEVIEPLPLPSATEPLVGEPASLAPTAPLAGIGFCEFCGEGCNGSACCPDCQSASRWGRFGRAVYRGLCCPDPCYEPEWRPLADAAFFTAAVRPVNQQRFRWDYVEDLSRPDRAEYFWARSDGSGKGPTPSPLAIDYDQLSHYVEVAHGAFGASFEYRYRALDADGRHDAGFGDMTIGTKTLLFDTSLVQFAFQFLTHVPAGAPNKGLGVGHTSLEPGVILGLCLSPDSYLQAEFNEWIPLAGDSDYAGAIFRYNVAYNRLIARPHPGLPIVGTLEINGWRFQDGAYTDITLTPTQQPASGVSYVNAAAGVRMFICDRADLGVSYATPITSGGWGDNWIRSELRFRY